MVTRHSWLRFALAGFLLLCFGPAIAAQGVGLRSDATVLYGVSDSSSRPAVVDYQKLLKQTPEWKTIKSEGVRKGTARYELLLSDADRRIRTLVEEVAEARGHDLVVGQGGIEDARGLKVADLTSAVAGRLESSSGTE